MSKPGNGPRYLKEARSNARLTQEQLANGAAVHVRTIRNLESGRIVRPHRATLEALASILDMGHNERNYFLAQWSPLINSPPAITTQVNSSNETLNELARKAFTT